MNILRCQRCGVRLRAKPKVKKLKYCPTCREAQQNQWREKIKGVHRARTEGRTVGAPGTF